MNSEYLDPDSSDRSVAADILLRQEPDEDENEEKEDEDEGGDDKEEDDEESDDGYSERASRKFSSLLRAGRSQSRQAQILERGTSRSSTDVRHIDQFKNRDIREFNLIFFNLACRVRRAEIPLLAYNFSKRASAIRRPS
jgi:hypothetical protein